jgi:hypothetical protein
MEDNYYFGDNGSKIDTWNIERDGYTFHCSYNSKRDWVEVICYEIPCPPRGANGRASYRLTAFHLAGEIIRDNT